MFNFKNAWSWICEAGTLALPDNSFQKKIIVRVNQLALYIFLINGTIGLAAYFLMMHSLWMLAGVVIEIMVSPIPIYLNFRRRYTRASGVLYAILCAATLFFCCLLGNLAEVNLMGVVLIASARFFFTNRKSRFWACLVAIAVVLGVQLDQWVVLIPHIAVGPTASTLLSRTAYAVAAFLVLLILAWNSYISDFLRRRNDQGGELAKKLLSSTLGKVYEGMLGASFFLSNVFELIKQNDVKGIRAAVSVFRTACKNSIDLIHNIFEYEDHMAGILPAPVYRMGDLRLLFQEIVDVYGVFGEGRHIVLQLELADDLPEKIPFDEKKLHQILANLVDNAVRCTHNETIVRIKARLEGQRLILAVEDGGDGITGHIRDRMFEPGVSENPDAPGLGLFVVRRLVRAFDGTIEVAQSDAGGARFTVSWLLPEASQFQN